MSDFVKDGGILDGLSLSDVSEVDPNELEQILQVSLFIYMFPVPYIYFYITFCLHILAKSMNLF